MFSIDPSKGDIIGPRKIAPPGWLKCRIEKVDIKKNDSSSNVRVTVTYKSGEYIFTSGHNVVNKNEQAQEIGQREVRTICACAKSGPVSDKTIAAKLKGKYLMVKVGIEPSRTEDGKHFDERNIVKSWDFIKKDEADADEETPEAKPAPKAEKKPVKTEAKKKPEPEPEPEDDDDAPGDDDLEDFDEDDDDEVNPFGDD